MARAELKARISLDARKWQQGLEQVRQQGNSLDGVFKKLGGAIASYFSVQAVTAWVQQVAAAVDHLKETSRNVGSGYEGWQTLKMVFEDLGQSEQSAASGLQKLSAEALNARGGADKSAAAFAKLGISLADLRKLDTSELFGRVAEAVERSGESVESLDAITDIFGNRLVARMIPALRSVGTEGFDAMAQKAKEAGLVMTASQVESISEMTRAWQQFKEQMIVTSADWFKWFRDGWRSQFESAEELAARQTAAIAATVAEAQRKTAQETQRAQAVVREAEEATATARAKMRTEEEARQFAAMSDDEKLAVLRRQLAAADTEAASAAATYAGALDEVGKAKERLAAVEARPERDEDRQLAQEGGDISVKDQMRITATEDLAAAQNRVTDAVNAQGEAAKKVADITSKIADIEHRRAEEAAKAQKAVDAEAAARAKAEDKERESAFAALKKAQTEELEAQMSLEEKLDAARQKAVETAREAEALEQGGYETTTKYAQAALEALEAKKALAALEEEAAEAETERLETADQAAKSLEDQVETVSKFKDFLSGMSSGELAAFLDRVRMIGTAVKGMDFSALDGLEKLGQIKLPGLSESQASAYVRSLQTLVKGLSGLSALPGGLDFGWLEGLAKVGEIDLGRGLSESQASAYVRSLQTFARGLSGLAGQFGDLGWVEKLALVGEISLPGLSDSQASAYVRSLQTLARGLDGIDFGDLAWVDSLGKLATVQLPSMDGASVESYVDGLRKLANGLAGIKVGDVSALQDLTGLDSTVTLQLQAPPTDALTLHADNSLEDKLAEIAKFTGVIASAKGVIYA